MGTPVEEVEIARFYTRSRRFPKMIGRMHDGTKIPGGPYTITQAAIGAILFLIAITTRAQWGTGSILIDLPICVGVAWGAAWGAGRIPSTRRNLLSVLIGGLAAMFKPAAGQYQGIPFRPRGPHKATGHVHFGTDITVPAADQAIAAEEPEIPVTSAEAGDVTAPVPALTPPPASARPTTLTAVERLLEQSRTN